MIDEPHHGFADVVLHRHGIERYTFRPSRRLRPNLSPNPSANRRLQVPVACLELISSPCARNIEFLSVDKTEVHSMDIWRELVAEQVGKGAEQLAVGIG